MATLAHLVALRPALQRGPCAAPELVAAAAAGVVRDLTDMDGHAHAGSSDGHAGGHGHGHGVHGSYRGHALPGVLFLLLGLHWSLAVMTLLLRQMQAHRARPRRGGRQARDGEPAADGKYSALLDAPAMECEAHAPETCCWISPAAAAAAAAAADGAAGCGGRARCT